MCLIPILVGVVNVYDGIIFSMTPSKGLEPIYFVQEVLIHITRTVMPRLRITWQIAQTLMRCFILVYAICKCFHFRFVCINCVHGILGKLRP